jgi:hypothetical protein
MQSDNKATGRVVTRKNRQCRQPMEQRRNPNREATAPAHNSKISETNIINKGEINDAKEGVTEVMRYSNHSNI